MNRQPFQTPPCWWSPRLSPFWVRMWRPLRRHRGYQQHGLCDVEVRGLDRLRDVMASDQGVLITPNHPSHADPFVLLEAADQLGSPFYFMTAWQVFAMTHSVGRRVLRQHGCFSINREGHDVRAFRQAMSILEESNHPLVIFPEGEVFHLNDRVMPFRKGAGAAAMFAARRSGRPVACVPCAMKFEYVSDPMPELSKLMGRLEELLSWTPRPEMPLARRIHRFAEGAMNLKEVEYLGSAGAGSLHERITRLMEVILGRMEDRYQVDIRRRTVPERIKQLRHRVIARSEAAPDDKNRRRQCQRDLDDLLFTAQLFSYPVDYISEYPNIDRLAETLDKLEEDVLGARTASKRGIRRAVVSFGEPVIVNSSHHRKRAAQAVTETLQSRVQGMLDEINRGQHPVRRPASAPAAFGKNVWAAPPVAA